MGGGGLGRAKLRLGLRVGQRLGSDIRRSHSNVGVSSKLTFV